MLRFVSSAAAVAVESSRVAGATRSLESAKAVAVSGKRLRATDGSRKSQDQHEEWTLQPLSVRLSIACCSHYSSE